MLATSNDQNLKKGQSLLFDGNGTMTTKAEMAVPTDASIQLFVKPTEENQSVTLLSWGHFVLGIQKASRRSAPMEELRGYRQKRLCQPAGSRN